MKNKRDKDHKIQILILVPQYLPGFNAGGPIRSISNMVQSLGDEFIFKIITSDRDLYSLQPFSNISPNIWMKVTKSEILYSSPGYLSIRNIYKLLIDTKYDLLYLNSFFHLIFSIIPLIIFKMAIKDKKPVLLAPRGEFSPGALSFKKIKKMIYIHFFKFVRLYNNIFWQASTEFEKNDILNIFNINQKDRIYIAPNIPLKIKSKNLNNFHKKKPGYLKIVFLSRISPKKNIDGALRILKGMKGEIKFDIYGPIGDEFYWKECLSIVDQLESNIGVTYRGPVNHEQVKDILPSYDLFLLPTRGENFGHVIIEALSSGLPVIISDQTPWQDISSYKAGFNIPIEDVEDYRQILNKFLEMNEKEYNIFRKGALNYAFEYFKNSNAVIQNRNMFVEILNN